MSRAAIMPAAVEGWRAPRQQRSEATLKAMLAAGRALIHASGSLTGFSLADLTREASVSVGAFYTRFPDKETFCALVLEDTLAEICSGLDARIASQAAWHDGPALTLCQCIVAFYIDTFRAHSGLFAAYMRHESIGSPLWRPIREANQRILDRMVPHLARQVPGGTSRWPEDEIRATIQVMVSALTCVVLDAPQGLSLHDARLQERLSVMMHRYLCTPA